MTGTTTGRRLLAALALALLVAVGVAGDAGAERVPEKGDSHQQGCRALQDAYNALKKERPNASPKRQAEIDKKIENIELDWKSIKCKSRYGDIALVVPTAPTLPAVRPTDGIVVDEPVLHLWPVGLAEGPTWGIEFVQGAPLAAPGVAGKAVEPAGPAPFLAGSAAPIAPSGDDHTVVSIDDPVPPGAESIDPSGDDHTVVGIDDPVPPVAEPIAPSGDDHTVVVIDDPDPVAEPIAPVGDDHTVVTIDDPVPAPGDDEQP